MYLKANSPHASAAGKSVIGFNVINGREVEGDLSLIQSKSAGDHRDLVGMFPDSGEKDIARAAKAAAEAFKTWSRVPAQARAEVARRTAEILATHREKLARIITREIGMTPREALGEVQEAMDACTFFGAEIQHLHGRTLTCGTAIQRHPVGVCGIMATGSSPLAAPVQKILPAILCGNTVVWKPSDNAPTAAYLFLRIMMEAGLPPGVVNTVNGLGRGGCGKHFLAGIDKGYYQSFAYVGPAALGRTVAEVCGRHLLFPSLDLVGKGAMLVMPDADLDRAAEDAARAAFAHAGQRRIGLANILLHEDCSAAFKQRFLARVGSLEVGNPMTDPDVAYGPLINNRTATAFKEQWEAGAAEGATLLTGGHQWTEANRTPMVKGNISHGAYMQPCVWEGVTPGMHLFNHLIPGPSVNLVLVKGFDEALAAINASPCGPANCLYTKNPALIQQFKREIRADVASINATVEDLEARLLFTGHGTHPGGQLVFDGFTRWQAWSEDAEEALELGPAAPLKTDWDSL